MEMTKSSIDSMVQTALYLVPDAKSNQFTDSGVGACSVKKCEVEVI